MCNCVKQYQEILAKDFQQKNPTHHDVKCIIQGVHFTVLDKDIRMGGHCPLIITSKYPNKQMVCKDKTTKSRVSFNYCPFCGEKIDKSKEVNVIVAATKTRELVLSIQPANANWPDLEIEPVLCRDYVLSLLDDIISGKVRTDEAHRNLGWAQAAMVSAGIIPVGGTDEINKSAIGAV